VTRALTQQQLDFRDWLILPAQWVSPEYLKPSFFVAGERAGGRVNTGQVLTRLIVITWELLFVLY